MSRRNGSRGFTLVEMMIAITLGLLVVGAVAAFAVSSIRAYADNMNSSRMTRDLRTSMTLVIRELRRSGYDAASVTRTLTSTTPTQFSAITVDTAKECVLYQYDRDGEGVRGGAPVASELRGVRRNPATNALEFASGGANCGANTGWVAISDPKVLSVSRFTPKLVEASFCEGIGSVQDPVTGKYTFTYGVGRVRMLALCMRGRSARDASVDRFIVDSVRLRADAPQFLSKVVDTPAQAVCTANETSGLYVNGVLDTASTLPDSPAQLATACGQ